MQAVCVRPINVLWMQTGWCVGNEEHVPKPVPGGSSSVPLWSLRVYQKAPRHALSQAFWKRQHQKTRCDVNNKLLLQENCRSNSELDCLMTWWVASIYAIISKSCLGTLRVQPGRVAEGAVHSSRLLCAQTTATGSGLTLQEGCQKSHVEIRENTLCGQISWAVGKSVWISDFSCFFRSRRMLSRPWVVAHARTRSACTLHGCFG